MVNYSSSSSKTIQRPPTPVHHRAIALVFDNQGMRLDNHTVDERMERWFIVERDEQYLIFSADIDHQ